MMFPPSIFGLVGVRPPGAGSSDRELVPRRLRGGESQISIHSGQFAGPICKFCVAIPKIRTAKSVGPPDIKVN